MKSIYFCLSILIVTVQSLPLPLNPNHAEEGNLFEGDIILTEIQRNVIRGSGVRTGHLNTDYRWLNNTIPFVITSDFDQVKKDAILRGMYKIEQKTFLKFVNRVDELDYIVIGGKPEGCYSYIGRIGGAQEINLDAGYAVDEGCLSHGTIIHEIMHAIGFYHMHSATERDDYVEIVYENIVPGQEKNFQKLPDHIITQFDIPYDLNSVMHYPETAFSANGKRTIIPYDSTAQIGQRINISELDVQRINAMYNFSITISSPIILISTLTIVIQLWG